VRVTDSASPFAGAKAGLVGAAFFTGAVGIFNFVFLEALKGTSLADLSKVAGCTTAPDTCFNNIINTYLPQVVLLPCATLGVLFGVLYGMYFEYIPGKGYSVRAIGLSLIFLIMLIVIGSAGNYTSTDDTELATIRAFDTVALIGYAYILSKLYRRLTREVNFESPSDKLKIEVDGRNYTHKMKTLSLHSSHKLKAPTEKGVFHQWLVSGGVSVEDPKSPETKMKVDGDGLLKIS
jgi:hypothetical protein